MKSAILSSDERFGLNSSRLVLKTFQHKKTRIKRVLQSGFYKSDEPSPLPSPHVQAAIEREVRTRGVAAFI